MRSFIVIMIFLVLKMAILPYGDEISPTLTDSILIEKSDKAQDPPENCNAFCNCSRCFFSVMLPDIQVPINPFMGHSNNAALLISSVSEGCFSIWQPPKLT